MGGILQKPYDYETLRESYRNLDGKLDQICDQNATLTRDFDNFSATIRQQIDQQQQDARALRRQHEDELERLRSALQGAEGESLQRTKRIDELNGKVYQLESQLAESNAKLESLRNEQHTDGDQFEQRHQNQGDQQNNLHEDTLNREIADLQSKLEYYQQLLDERNRELQILQEKLDNQGGHEKELKILRTDNADLKLDLERVRFEQRQQQDQLTQATAEKVDREEQIQRLSAQQDELVQNYTAQIVELEETIKSLRAIIETLNEEGDRTQQ